MIPTSSTMESDADLFTSAAIVSELASTNRKPQVLAKWIFNLGSHTQLRDAISRFEMTIDDSIQAEACQKIYDLIDQEPNDSPDLNAITLEIGAIKGDSITKMLRTMAIAASNTTA